MAGDIPRLMGALAERVSTRMAQLGAPPFPSLALAPPSCGAGPALPPVCGVGAAAEGPGGAVWAAELPVGEVTGPAPAGGVAGDRASAAWAGASGAEDGGGVGLERGEAGRISPERG
ncbi:hypothetical protein MGR01S_05720 [Meiothermus granaticius NBRC 107808]|nr:hypothetical protein MGR01S_05720 [Meiothermus granaticius NBRC 107808]